MLRKLSCTIINSSSWALHQALSSFRDLLSVREGGATFIMGKHAVDYCLEEALNTNKLLIKVQAWTYFSMTNNYQNHKHR